MLLVVDHRDSFTWNLVHTLGRFADDVQVRQSETLTVSEVRALAPRGIVLSPGPGRPEEARETLGLVESLASEIPMLGVCLGHQIVCHAFAARVVHAAQVFHGRVSLLEHAGEGLFAGLPSPFRVARYHSLVVDEATLPRDLKAVAHADSGELMAVQHRTLPLWSVQFHPESFLTEYGAEIVARFVAQLPGHSPARHPAGRFGA